VLDIILSGDADLGTKRWLYRFDYCLVSGLWSSAWHDVSPPCGVRR